MFMPGIWDVDVEDTDIFFNLTKLIGHLNDGDAPI